MKQLKCIIVAISLLSGNYIKIEAKDLPEVKFPLATGFEKPFVIYNNWSAYDELSDNIPQTEKLCMQMLDEVIRLKEHGIQIDCYLMDAFWFDVDGGYRKWHKQHWPDGPKQWLKKCKENGIIPGLWFSTNLIRSGNSPMLNPIPEWEGSQTSNPAVLSLFEGNYLNHLMETLQMYANQGFVVFKFDFAYFDAATDIAKETMLWSEIEEANKAAFIRALKVFRAKNPHVKFIGYNGFGGEMENTTNPFRKTIDPRWLEVFDTMYSGDPRFSDVPMMNLWRSQDMYSDHMVQQFAFNGLPLSRIDNCSFMIGNTGTCYKRGIAAWKSSLILNMARGGWLNVYHGNIDLLNDADTRWFAEVQKVYLSVQQFGQTAIIGGIPGKSEVYGYKSVTKDGILYTVVNPSQAAQEFELPFTDDSKGRILFTDKGFVPTLYRNKTMLGAEQMVVIGFGEFARKNDWGLEEDVIIPQRIDKTDVLTMKKNEHTSEIIVKNITGNIRIVFKQLDNNGVPFRSWGGAPPYGTKMDEYLKISAKQKNKSIPVKINYDRMIWSGLSWGVAEIGIENINPQQPLAIICQSKEGKSDNFQIDIYNVIY
jgi:hypothetical protein